MCFSPSWSGQKRDPDQWVHHRCMLSGQHVWGCAGEYSRVRPKVHQARAEWEAAGQLTADVCLFVAMNFVVFTNFSFLSLSCSLRLCSWTSSWRSCPIITTWRRQWKAPAPLWETDGFYLLQPQTSAHVDTRWSQCFQPLIVALRNYSSPFINSIFALSKRYFVPF